MVMVSSDLSRNGSIGGRARAFESDGDKGIKRQRVLGLEWR